jgi:heme exporter protein D
VASSRSGRFKNATQGFDYVVGEIVWLGFLACALAFIVLVAVALSRRTTRRHEAVARGAPSEQLREAWCG